MSPKLPVISADDLVKALEKFGYVVVRQKGSQCACLILPTRSANR